MSYQYPPPKALCDRGSTSTTNWFIPAPVIFAMQSTTLLLSRKTCWSLTCRSLLHYSWINQASIVLLFASKSFLIVSINKALSLSTSTCLKLLIHTNCKASRITQSFNLKTIPFQNPPTTLHLVLSNTLLSVTLCLLVDIEPSILILTHLDSGLCQLFSVLDLHAICSMWRVEIHIICFNLERILSFDFKFN